MIDAYNDPYQRRATAGKQRLAFEKLKKTNGFIHWKMRQFKVQEGQCAYCRIHLDTEGIVTHIDHVTPLYYEGKNDYKNFVLSCRRCNIRKWVKDSVVVPDWIVRNDERMRANQRYRTLIQKQQRLFNKLTE